MNCPYTFKPLVPSELGLAHDVARTPPDTAPSTAAIRRRRSTRPRVATFGLVCNSRENCAPFPSNRGVRCAGSRGGSMVFGKPMHGDGSRWEVCTAQPRSLRRYHSEMSERTPLGLAETGGGAALCIPLNPAQLAKVHDAHRRLGGDGQAFLAAATRAVVLAAELVVDTTGGADESAAVQPAAMSPASDNVAVYMGYMSDLLQYERSRKADLQQRGVGVVTTSSVLSALFFGFISAIAGTTSIRVPGIAQAVLAGALGCFAAAAACGILTDWAVGYKDLPSEEKEHLASFSSTPGITASETVARWTLRKIVHNQRSNRWRSRSLTAALCFDALAAVLLATAVAVILVHR